MCNKCGIDVELLPNGKTVRLLEDLDIYGFVFVSRGFKSDLASIPKIFHPVLPKLGKYSIPSIIHDFLYESGLFSRKESDKIFDYLNKMYGVKLWKRKAIYYGLRVGGWVAWNKYRKQDAEGV